MTKTENERLAVVETKIDNIVDGLTNIKDTLKNVVKTDVLIIIQADIKEIKDDMKYKMSNKAFASWLSALALAIGIITTILFLVR